jgi:Fe-S oxidoreductase
MAGSFGYSHFELSMKIGEQRLFPAVREHEGPVAACGFSCRHQIEDGTGKRAKHVIELLASAVTKRKLSPEA